ncbi:MAG TPA: ABC transporter permease [Terriglobales bacterium]|nr:ABC transporter permease [Terriglobales bacterium]
MSCELEGPLGDTTLSALPKLVAKILITVVIGGFLGATLVRLAPGFGVDEDQLDTRLSHQSVQAVRDTQNADSNLFVFYFRYLSRLFHGDLGNSRTLQRPVLQLVAERLPETLKSVAMGLALGWSAGFLLAVAIVMSRAWYLDLLGSLLVGVLLCLPAAVLALLFVLAQAPARLLLGLVVFPKIFRYSRNLLARSSALPHVLTARAKGLGNTRVLVWHILPTAAPQLLALLGVTVSVAFTAAIPMEALCDMPGIGQLAWKAALGRDVALLVNLTMIVTLATLVANSASDMIGKTFRVSQA